MPADPYFPPPVPHIRPEARPPRRSHVASAPTYATPLSLEIPKADRRPPRHRRAPRRLPLAAALFVSTLLIGSAVAAGLLATHTESKSKMRAMAMSGAQNALLGLGFGIDQVSLSGHHYTSDQEIYQALDLEHARTFAAFDAGAALKRLEVLPWIESANITRVYPGTLNVEVHERRPSALWSRKGKTYLIDPTGRVLGAAAAPHGWDLPMVAGEGANTQAALLFAALERQPEIQALVELAARIGERRWSLVLKNGSRIELGADREAEGLEQVAQSPELRLVLSGAPTIVDVRTQGRFTIRPTGLGLASESAEPIGAAK